jgi:hypothetical protein
MLETAVDEAWLWLMTHPGCRAFLYYRPAAGETWGAFMVVPETEQAPDGWLPVRPESIPQGTKQQIRQWLEPIARRLPILGVPAK